jgi:hypothetical protein
MQVIHGRIQRFLRERAGEMTGFILAPGIEVRFPLGNSPHVSAIAQIGSYMEIHGWVCRGAGGKTQFHAIAIANFDSNQLVYLKEPPHEPETPLSSTTTSTEVASLAPPQRSQFASGPETLQLGVAALSHGSNRQSAARGIDRAYDDLHRAQALLAYFRIMDIERPNVGQLLEGAKRSYEQALSVYLTQDFSAACELAATSSGLSLGVEIVISRSFRSSPNSPTLVPAPPSDEATSRDSMQVQDHLLRVQKLLSRIHWLLENGTMPSDDMEDAQKIAGWSKAFLQQARQLFRGGNVKDASDLTLAAEAIAQSAEHRCKKCYVNRESDSRLTPAAPSPP